MVCPIKVCDTVVMAKYFEDFLFMLYCLDTSGLSIAQNLYTPEGSSQSNASRPYTPIAKISPTKLDFAKVNDRHLTPLSIMNGLRAIVLSRG